ncbi:MAG: polyprenyl diphosphate synthase [Minisyncoccales bacterium]
MNKNNKNTNKENLVIPKHIAIIPDGNRRWAKEQGKNSFLGHKKAAEKNRLEEFIKEAKNSGVEYFSLWGFSTENWKRSDEEKKHLFQLFSRVIDDIENIVNKYNIRFRHFGRKDRLPSKLISKINNLEKTTKNNKGINVCILLDYGGRDEIIRAVNNVLKSGKKKINEEEFCSFLDTKDIPEPDIIIRTSGEQRLSGFMPFQGIYAELFFVEKHFPDFGSKDLKKIIQLFGKRKRRFGGN